MFQEDEGTYSCLAENVAGRVEERLQVLLTDSQEEADQRYSPGLHRYPGEEEELQQGYPGDDRVPPYQRYPEEEDREENYNKPPHHQRYPEEEEDSGEAGQRISPQSGFQFQFEEREREEEPGLQSMGEVEHEVKTQEGMNVNLNCVAIGSFPEDAVADWSREDGKEIDRRHKANTERHEGVTSAQSRSPPALLPSDMKTQLKVAKGQCSELCLYCFREPLIDSPT